VKKRWSTTGAPRNRNCPAIRKADAPISYPLTITGANNYDLVAASQSDIDHRVKILYLERSRWIEQICAWAGADEIQNIVQMAEYRDYLSLDERMSAQLKDISQALHQAKPTIVHFAGHGEDGTLCLETADGMTYPVEADALAAMLEEFADSIDCVVLNACDTGYLAETIAEHIDYVIGMSETISDEAAIAFSVGFYKALGAGRAIPEAHRLGCAEIGIYGIPESLKPRLVKRQSILEGV
jgi:hypothetical protein